MEEKRTEQRLIEIEKASYVEQSGLYVITAIQLVKNVFRRKNSEPYTRGSSGRYVGELPVVLVGDVFEVEIETRYSKQFGNWYQIVSAARKSSVTLRQIERFLQKNIRGVTLDRLEQILDKYGLDTLQAIQNDPHSFDFAGFFPEDSEALRDALNDISAYEEIVKILTVNTVDCRLAYPLFRKYGATAPRILQSNPYTPYMDERYDFQTGDLLFLKQGNNPGDPKRCLYAIKAMLEAESIRCGDLFLCRDCLEEKLMKFLHMKEPPFTDDVLESSLCALKTSRIIDIETSFGCEQIYLRSNYEAERTAAEDMERMWLGTKQVTISPDDINAYLYRGGYSLDQKQEQAVLTALTSPITIISGGPGTGKTYTTKVIVDTISALCPAATIKLCAPTGRAKVRISEVTGRESSTIHSLLELKKYKQEQIKPKGLDCDYLIVDEFSMVDMQICQYLFAAAASKTHVIIVGDYNQLPSVGPGQVLKDLIRAEVFPVVSLSHVFRQDVQGEHNRVHENAYRIYAPVSKERCLRFANPKKPGEDFYLLEEDDPRRIQDKIVEVVGKAIQTNHVPLDSIAVLSPIHDGPLGVDSLNTVLQDTLNPSGEKIKFKNREFRLHDKVIHIETDYTLGVYNGEIGVVVEIGYTSRDALTVDYSGKRVTYPRTKLKKLDLAYAMTVHKMQGSECRLVVMPVLNNNLSQCILYTAWTRAKKSVVLIGSKAELLKGLQKPEPDRNTNLCKRLQARILHRTFAAPAVPVQEGPVEDEQQSLFLIQPDRSVSKLTSTKNVSKAG